MGILSDVTKRILCLFAYVLFVSYIATFGGQLQKIFLYSADLIPFPVVFSSVSFPIIIGLLLALPRFRAKAKQEGSWKFACLNFIIIGVPALVAANSLLLRMHFGYGVWYIPVSYSTLLVDTGGIVFGYILLHSFYKSNEC